MHILNKTVALGLFSAALIVPAFAQDAANPAGTFVDSYGSSFTFSLCGDAGTDLCAILTTLKGESATPENLAFVGKQVMQAKATGPNEWKGELAAGGISASATVTQTGPDTIDIQGCRAAVLCQTLTYNRS